MLKAYSQNVTVVAGEAIPFNGVTLEKGCSAVLSSPTTIELNQCGVYMVACGVSAAASETIQLSKDGVLQPDARRTGTSPGFTTLVQVPRSNTPCPCTSPTVLQLISVTAGTLADASIVVTKVC